MSQPEEQPKGDPWHAFGYIVAGVAFYGFLGWLADQWLGTRYLVAVGIIAGAGFGIYMTFARFRPDPAARHPQDPQQNDE
ncbi:AtpZ/AtpI family protein [Nocardioides bizhenqiangii]|uniref:AtpZ/AtpI family protein n=1 Tax=Nocardioides bizhenqiangii TaxID=3095076 RepID=A0ABZ0ZNY1_9ACTN|nr:AtpZ/AtpI family protein [Nocardioides sp. HM61]WQQ25193.1 AtpZ/AtpI family protein [Nocardioides sp. HM61]